MQELQIPNGYFHLWQMYLAERGVDVTTLDFLQADEKQHLLSILSLPIDTQSAYLFFHQLIEKNQTGFRLPTNCF
jgi:hypothetical protein